ncbi:MAG: hypothetical protein C4520_08630 [Candidatus Abyssobacteria bacterium SURF_5]|uniref:NodB homology domain-containing protein n=1 Tax=Abyssobacteria bacterium (strain SURF_5) TaxID=2093360 RepID=A0A3A4NNF5_ABYX5|nr:MAG: hypothetical protein C4520_08630 [Candidatus Abyssubacteria bacterium SURF_5]
MANPLMLLIGCDCDPDRPRYGGSRYDVRHSAQKWRGISEGIERLIQALDRVERAFDLKPKIVFCVRSDSQMQEMHGTAGWMLTEYGTLWRALEGRGHEIAWHPHLWRWSDKWGCWFQENEDSDWISESLTNGFTEFGRTWGKNPFTCHMGWTFHNDTSMQTVAKLGVRLDFSASPGVFFKGGPGAAGTRFDNRIDWRGTPQQWYHPSTHDYRRPNRNDEPQLDLVEIPKFTSKSGLLKTAKHFSLLRKGKSLEPAQAVFLQITALPLLYGQVIRERLHTDEAEPFFATYFHPDELLEKKDVSAARFLYSAKHLEENIASIIRKTRMRGREIKFVIGPEALHSIGKG